MVIIKLHQEITETLSTQIDFFFFENYKINSIENITLAILWKYTYDNKYNEEVYQNIPFSTWLKQFVSSLSALHTFLALDAERVHEVLSSEDWGNAQMNMLGVQSNT